MEWTDQAIVLGARRQGEGSLTVSLLTRLHGRHKGLVRGGARSRQRGLYEPGNVVTATWHARLAEHLGLWRLEPGTSYAGQVLDDPLRLACLEAATTLADVALPERSPFPALFDGLGEVLVQLGRDEAYAVAHLRWELTLLGELGYGLDLAACTVTGQTSDLAYVSPRTGRAVSRTAGAAYKDRLLILPRLFGGAGSGGSEASDVLDGLTLTGAFLDRVVPQRVPPARTLYIDRLARLVAISGGIDE
jgi:DNA repair protein RecO (recombination protein O)